MTQRAHDVEHSPYTRISPVPYIAPKLPINYPIEPLYNPYATPMILRTNPALIQPPIPIGRDRLAGRVDGTSMTHRLEATGNCCNVRVFPALELTPLWEVEGLGFRDPRDSKYTNRILALGPKVGKNCLH